MSIHIVFVAEFSPDAIEVSHRLPADRIASGYDHIKMPVHQAYKLTRLWVESDEPPTLPEGDITRERLGEWLPVLSVVRTEDVDQRLQYRGYYGLCVDVKMAAVEMNVYGTVFEVRLTNIGPYPIGLLSVRWMTKVVSAPDEPAVSGFDLSWRGFPFAPVCETRPRQVNPGETLPYVLTQPDLQHCLQHFDTHPSDDYHLSVVAAPPGENAVQEIARVNGDELGFMVRKLKEFIRTEGQ